MAFCLSRQTLRMYVWPFVVGALLSASCAHQQLPNYSFYQALSSADIQALYEPNNADTVAVRSPEIQEFIAVDDKNIVQQLMLVAELDVERNRLELSLSARYSYKKS